MKTASGATVVQIVYSSRRGSRDIEHIGSAHDEVQLEVLKDAARQRLVAGQDEVVLGGDPRAGRHQVPVHWVDLGVVGQHPDTQLLAEGLGEDGFTRKPQATHAISTGATARSLPAVVAGRGGAASRT